MSFQLLIRLSAIFVLAASSTAFAVCPNEDLSTRGGVSSRPTISPQDIDVDEGTATASVPVSLPVADMAIDLTNGGFDPSLRVRLAPRMWRFRTARSANIQLDNLTVSYVVNADDHLIADRDSTSRIPVIATTRNIVRVNRGNRTIFRGFVDLEIDYINATRAGRYRGVLNVTVDCQP